MFSIDPYIVERFTGQRQICSVEAALAQLTPAATEVALAERNCKRAARRLFWCAIRRELKLLASWVAQLPNRRSIPVWVIMLALCSICSLFFAVVAIVVFQASLPFVLVVAVAPFFGVVFQPIVFPKDVSCWTNAANKESAQLKILQELRNAAQRTVKECRQRYEDARRIHLGVTRARDSQFNRLLQIDFISMTGTQFELFLADVFAHLGYIVQRIGQAGDHGVDLIISRDKIRIAVQAKCHNYSVNNSAVQEVYTGMRIHGCDKCIAITSNIFTSHAHDAAFKVNCRLIEGDQISDLIRGKIQI